ncbi:hypothetical protein OIO90_006318 [Microbotryomycetes sp. JL221]|nr:hypothetical protein OIO90_006318 [Microbotryomycetes sp. JL221]
MLYVANAQPATVQLDALKCDFVKLGVTNLVINKLTRLEVYNVDFDGDQLELAFEVPLSATIAALAAYKLNLFTLAYSKNAYGMVTTTSSESLFEQFGRPSECQTILIDRNLECIIVHAYCGLLRVIPIEHQATSESMSIAKTRRGSKTAQRRTSDATADGTSTTIDEGGPRRLELSQGYNVRLPALNVSSICLLSPADNLTYSSSATNSAPLLALVHLNHAGNRTLLTHRLDLDGKELVDGPIAATELLDPGSELVIPVGNSINSSARESGVLVVGEESVTWHASVASGSSENKGKRRASSSSTGAGPPARVMCRLPVGMIQAWTQVDSQNDAFLMGDIYGKLLMLKIVRSASGKVLDLVASDVGDTSSPTALVMLSPELLYLASRFGDSQLIRIPSSLTDTIDGQHSHMAVHEDLQLLSSVTSLAPILDCCLVQSTSSGTSRVVTCSGAYKGGSLRVVSQGIGVSELVNLDVNGTQHLWSISTHADVLLVLGLIDETRFIRVECADDGDISGVDEAELPHLDTSQATIYAGLVGNFIAQAVADAVMFTNADGSQGGIWRPADNVRITHAACHGSHLLLAIEGGRLELLTANNEGLLSSTSVKLSNEVSCVHLFAFGDHVLAVAGLWASNDFQILTVPSLEPVCTHAPPTSYPIRSVVAATFPDGIGMLFAGLGDGSLATYTLQPNGSIDQTSERVAILGTRPIDLTLFTNKGKNSVLALADQPTLVARSNDRLMYSNMNMNGVSSMTSIASGFSALIATATSSTVQIGRVDETQRMDIRTISLDEDEPRRISYSSQLDMFAVVCLKRDIDRSSGAQSSQGSVRFFDGNLASCGRVDFGLGQEGQSVAVASIDGEDVFIVGIVQINSEEDEPTKGHLHVYRQQRAGQFSRVAETRIGGCPYALACVGSEGHVSAAINSQVAVFALNLNSSSLHQVASWGGAFVAFNLAVNSESPNRIICGDALRSVTILEFVAGQECSLKEVCRDYDAHYMCAVEAVSTTELIGAETDLNLFTLQHHTAGSNESGDAMQLMGKFHLGEMVSRFRQGTLSRSNTEMRINLCPKLVYTTSAGSIGVIIELDAECSKLLSALERNMRHVVPTVGQLSQEQWRAFKSDRREAPSAGFVDGDFVSRCIELSAEDMDRVMAGGSEHERLPVSKHELVKLVEELSRLH